MATTATSTTEQRDQERTGKSSIVIVDLGEPQSPKLVRRLRKGRGKLLTHVERIIDDLVEAGTVKSTAQPVVIVVRELPMPPWPFDDEDD